MDDSKTEPLIFSLEQWGYASNKHLNQWMSSWRVAESERQELLTQMDPKMAGTQERVSQRKVLRGEIYDSFERIIEKRAEIVAREGGGIWREDPLSNEVDASLKLNNTIE